MVQSAQGIGCDLDFSSLGHFLKVLIVNVSVHNQAKGVMGNNVCPPGKLSVALAGL